jgi:hypothetical protein
MGPAEASLFCHFFLDTNKILYKQPTDARATTIPIVTAVEFIVDGESGLRFGNDAITDEFALFLILVTSSLASNVSKYTGDVTDSLGAMVESEAEV